MPRALIPNSTQIPDVILDHWMAELTGADFKVLLYIARRTYGFGKDSDTISLKQIATGIRRKDGAVLDRGVGSSRSSVARSLKVLEGLGMVLRKTNLADSGQEFEENTYSINLDWEPRTEPGGSPPEGGDQDGGGVVSNRDHLVSGRDHVVSKEPGGWSQNETRVVSNWYIQETVIQETEQETAAAGEAGAAAELVSLLVRKGVGRSAAVRLAREKPDDCRQYLDWLPFAEVKTTEGAWLVNAIRDGYGPPKAVAKRLAEERAAKAVTASGDGPQSSQAERGDEKASRLRETYHRLFKITPDAITAFETFFSNERDKATKYAATFSEKARNEVERNADTEEFRLTIFERWVRGEGKGYLSPKAERVRGSRGQVGGNPVVTIAP